MRYPEGHKEAVREEIIKSAAKALRRSGLAGVSIPALMKKAGLTHGGFYVHFNNRDELVAEAILAACEETRRSVFKDAGVRDVLNAYVSEGHAQHPEMGCVLAALGTEARVQSAPVRRAFARVARGFLELVDGALRGKSSKGAASDEALAVASRMVGALVLARLVDDDALAARILAAARQP
jgi:AcrR family transcriptional regulator